MTAGETALVAVSERIETIGKTMARAGLRSYTDEKGRIFVAAGSRGTPNE